ncbi:uncharacterized protein J3R85_012464 [Psidium guajava]|nr:uncharacterized protein J3R85_012464 [Psidium guajava]
MTSTRFTFSFSERESDLLFLPNAFARLSSSSVGQSGEASTPFRRSLSCASSRREGKRTGGFQAMRMVFAKDKVIPIVD